MQNLSSAQARVNDWMRDHGAQFAVIRQGRRQILDNPFDPIPRTLPGAEFTFLEQGLIQRINALNLFLNDIYHQRMILKDGIIPEEFVFSSPDFRPECMNLTPAKSIYTHITATDLIRTTDGVWYAMEDSLSGARRHHLSPLCQEALQRGFSGNLPDPHAVRQLRTRHPAANNYTEIL